MKTALKILGTILIVLTSPVWGIIVVIAGKLHDDFSDLGKEAKEVHQMIWNKETKP